MPIDNVDVIMGDTDIVKEGGGSHSGRSMRHAATVISMAAPELIASGKAVAATILGTTPDEVEFQDGRFASKRANRTYDFLELAKEAHGRGIVLAVAKDNEMHTPVYPNGCAVCEVEVDPDTGRVHLTRYASVDDVGRCINPMTVDGQTHGSIAHGVGEALFEQICFDRASGRPLTELFEEYGMPSSTTLPPLTTEIVEVLSPTNPLGIKSGSEGATAGAPAAVISGIVDALVASEFATSPCRQLRSPSGKRLKRPKRNTARRTASAPATAGSRSRRARENDMAHVTIRVNGKEETREIKPRTLLVEFLRDHLGLTGTHVGCDTTQCGCCVVLVDGHSVNSCTMLAVQANGTSVTTIEGVAEATSCTRCRRPSVSITHCNAASAHPAW